MDSMKYSMEFDVDQLYSQEILFKEEETPLSSSSPRVKKQYRDAK